MENKIAKRKTPLPKSDSAYLTECVRAGLKEVMKTDSGRYITRGQGIAERLIATALYAESNSDHIQASKVIREWTEGRAAVIKQDETKEMPRVIFAMSDDELTQINGYLEQDTGTDEQEDPAVLVETDDGEEFLL